MNSCGVPQAAPIQNEPMPGRRGYAGEKVLCIPVLLPRVARELLPARGGGPDGFAVFFYAGLGLCGRLTLAHAAGTAELCGGRRCLPVSLIFQGSPENCLHRRWRQRIAPTAGGARELPPPQVVLSTKSLDGCIIMLSAAGGSRLLIPNKGVSRHEVFHLPCCI